MVVKYIKITFLTMFIVLVGVIFSTPKINAQTVDEVVIDFDTFYNGELVTHSQRTVKQGETLIYEVEDFPDGVFMFWFINGTYRCDLQQNITITIYERTFLEIHFGSELYNSAFNQGIELGEILGYDRGYQNGVYTVYENGFGGIINPYTNEFYTNENSFPYGIGWNDGVEVHNDYSFMGLLTQVFVGLGSILAIELLPNITIGAIVAVPIVFGIIYFILGKKRDD